MWNLSEADRTAIEHLSSAGDYTLRPNLLVQKVAVNKRVNQNVAPVLSKPWPSMMTCT